jgi:hypothetical protein
MDPQGVQGKISYKYEILATTEDGKFKTLQAMTWHIQQ